MQINALDSLLASVADSLDRHSLEALAATRAFVEAAARWIGWLSANDGELTEEEWREYQSAIVFANFFGHLQSQARRKFKAAA